MWTSAGPHPFASLNYPKVDPKAHYLGTHQGVIKGKNLTPEKAANPNRKMAKRLKNRQNVFDAKDSAVPSQTRPGSLNRHNCR